jgi:hypothetical protein
LVFSKKSRTLFLLFVPIVIAEFLTGSTPLPALLSPLTLPTLLGLYGAGALLVREVTVVWKKGWPTILALGCAYGVVEEGLDVKSWFNPHWGALGILGTYGRVFGINWVWAVELTLFHSIFSIAIPILLATLLFPASAGSRWLPGRRLPLVILVFVADVLFGFAFFPYSPPPVQYLVAASSVVILVWLAHMLPRALSPAGEFCQLKERVLVAIGLFSTTTFFVLFWVLPNLPVPPVIDILLVAVLGWSVRRFLIRNRLSERQVFALICGALGFLIGVAILSLDFLAGAPFVGIALAVSLFAVRRRLQDRPLSALATITPQPSPVTPAPLLEHGS